MPALIDRTGRRYGRLVVLRRSENQSGREVVWICQCDCGNMASVKGMSLANGDTGSCGCYQKELFPWLSEGKTHGLISIPEYYVWQSMRMRCSNPAAPNYASYGGRGIRVCEEWRFFDNFLIDMGFRPSEDHSLDRIDNNGNYEPGNCRWATRIEQNNNRRDNRFIEFKERTQTVAQWARETGINRTTIEGRLEAGWGIEEALTTPIMGRGK